MKPKHYAVTKITSEIWEITGENESLYRLRQKRNYGWYEKTVFKHEVAYTLTIKNK